MKMKMLVMDVDGTLTDGKIYMSATGEAFKAFNIKDGYTIYTLDKIGIIPVIITGRESQIVARRAEELKIKEIHQGVGNKLAKLQEVAARHGVSMDEIAYIGDDYNDVECMEACGFTGCPQDAEEDIKTKVDYVCTTKSGEGALREFVKQIMNRQ
jgi:3-deoxy-D-manno-octulosonate 8-phosphate phosphatase (KDO 8-P phosphatase)